jgi:predicted amidohydrolase
MRVAAIQMNSGPDVSANLQLAGQLLDEAAAAECVLAVLPENFALMPERGKDKARYAEKGTRRNRVTGRFRRSCRRSQQGTACG